MSADPLTDASATSWTRPPGAHIVFDPEPQEIDAEIDWSSWYLTDEEDMGEGCEQNLIIWILRQILTVLSRERGWQHVLIGADQFFAWVEEQPLVRVSPDVYLLDDPPPRPLPASWQTWREGHRPPRLAFEIVSEDWDKDYKDNPPKYAHLGVRELVIFDPEVAAGVTDHPERVALQLFRREADGRFARVYRGSGPVHCRELGAWLVVHVEGEAASLLISRDSVGQDLVLTVEQALDEALNREVHERAARLEAEQREAKAAQREAKERQARRDAEEKLTVALAELERLRRRDH